MTAAAPGPIPSLEHGAGDMRSSGRGLAEDLRTVDSPRQAPLPAIDPLVRGTRQATNLLDGPSRSRWPWALLGSVALHLAVVAAVTVHWSLHKPEAPPPAAMVVELAVMPASPRVPQTEIPPGPQQIKSAPKPIDAEKMKFDPPPQVDAALKPSFTVPPKQEVKPADAPVIAKKATETTAPQATPAPVDDKNKAPVEGNNVAPPSDVEQAWEGRLLARLERNKRYPATAQAAGQQDTVFVRLVIDRRGKLVEASIKKSAGFAPLDGETLALARRASPFPAPPDSITGDRIVRVVPVEFYIAKRR